MTRTALIVVDYQNDFADRKGALYVTEGDRIWPAIEALVPIAGPVVFTQDWHDAGDPSFKSTGAGGEWPDHCVAGTWGAQLAWPLHGGNLGDMVIRKTGYSAVKDDAGNETGLHGYLRDNWVDHVTVAGLALDFCVKATALHLAEKGYRVAVPRATTRAVFPEKAKETWDLLKAAGIETP